MSPLLYDILTKSLVYLFPLQLAFGVVGNTLNLMVLLSRPMRSRTNTLLSATACADIIFLLALAPKYMARTNYFVQRNDDDCPRAAFDLHCVTRFYYFYVEYKTQFTFVANWFSAASTWLIVAVSFERLLAIKQPFKARYSACNIQLVILLIAVFLLSAVLTFHHNIAFRVERVPVSNGSSATNSTQISAQLVPQWHDYVQASILVNFALVYIAPLIVLCIVNTCLIYYLRNRHAFFPTNTTTTAESSRISASSMRHRTESQATRCSEIMIPLRSISEPLVAERKLKWPEWPTTPKTSSTSIANNSSWSRQSRRVTLMVAVIISCYVITYTPSVCLSSYLYIFRSKEQQRSVSQAEQQLNYVLTLASNALVISGKMANFFLFCTSSQHFRARLRHILCSQKQHASQHQQSQHRQVQIFVDWLLLRVRSSQTIVEPQPVSKSFE